MDLPSANMAECRDGALRPYCAAPDDKRIMRFVRASDSGAMEQMLEDLEKVRPTYSDIGATLAGRQPDGFRHDRYETLLATELGRFGEP